MKNTISIPNNELLDKLSWRYNGSFDNYSVKDLIKFNILDDYSKGIKFCDLKVFPSDLNWVVGGVAKSWQNGDILNIDDVIVVLDKNGESILYYDDSRLNPYRFKVIDVKTIYEGQVLIELKLMECKFLNDL